MFFFFILFILLAQRDALRHSQPLSPDPTMKDPSAIIDQGTIVDQGTIIDLGDGHSEIIEELGIIFLKFLKYNIKLSS